jgi:serine/threonine protein kinase
MMTHGQSAEVLFEQALALGAKEQIAFLDRACGDSAELRAMVEELLERDAAAGSFLKSPLFGRPADGATALTADEISDAGPHSIRVNSDQFREGDVLAVRFRVVRFIANGGMGEVYEVEDGELQGVRLALKTILPQIAEKPDMQARFEREVLLARRVVHSNLCPIYVPDYEAAVRGDARGAH